jgi:alpha-tubulin suppressor-like RCC1 family protein
MHSAGSVLVVWLALFWTALGVGEMRAEGGLTALGWGRDDSGQLGLGTKVVFETPTVLPQTGALAGKTIIKTVAGARHVLALTADQKVFAWGDGLNGLLGGHYSRPSSAPVEMPLPEGLAGKTVIDLAVTSSASYLLTADFQLWGWGNIPFGGVGDAPTPTPVRVDSGALTGKKVVKIACGSSHLIALTEDGLVASMGANSSGQLGDNTTVSKYSPVQIVDSNEVLQGLAVVDIAAGSASSMLRTSDGSLFAWGNNVRGQLGVGDKVNRLVPTRVEGTLVGRSVRAMAIANFNGYAITTDNQLHSWGGNSAGELAIQSTSPSERLQPDLALMTSFSNHSLQEVLAGQQCAAVRTASGTVFTWGVGRSGVQGRNPPISVSVPSLVSFAALGGVGLVKSLSMDGGQRLSAILADGRVVQWGSGLNGRAGNGQPYWREVPQTLPATELPANEKWSILAARGTLSVGLSSAGKLYSWGGASWGYNPVLAPVANPRRVLGDSDFNNKVFTAISLGEGHTAALSQEGEIFGWGSGSSGQLGNGVFQSTIQSSPVQVVTAGTPMAGKTVTKIAAGGSHTLALTSDGGLFAWGSNSLGQLGDSTTTNRNLPIAVPMSGALAGKTVVAIAAGNISSYALTSDGLVFAWGSNSCGRLGTGVGSPAMRRAPAAVVTNGPLAGKTIVHIAAGDASAYAITSDGSLFGWGQDVMGSEFNEAPVSIPLPFGDTHRVPVAAAANGTSMHVLTEDGTVFSQGRSRFGALGLGPMENSVASQLRKVPGTGQAEGLKVLSVATAGRAEHVLAIAEAGTPELIIEYPVGTALPRDSAKVSFGEVPAGVTVQRTLRLIYSGETDITLLGVSFSPFYPSHGPFSDGGVRPTLVSKGQSLDLVIEFNATTPRSYRSWLSLVVQRPHHGLFEADLHFSIDLTAHVLGPVPRLVEDPLRSQIVAEGATARFTVGAIGLPPLSYQWRHRGKNLPGATSAVLELQDVSLAQAGDYSVVVKSVESVESLPAHLTVVRLAGGSRILGSGNSTTLTLKAAGSRLTYQWFRNGWALPEDPRIRGVNSSTLRIQPLAADSTVDLVGHTGSYTCQVSRLGSEPFMAGTIALLVTDLRPRFLEPISLPSAAIGVDYSFTVPMDPNPRRAVTRFSAKGLPAGLTINPQTGVISGRPRQSRGGGFPVLLIAENREGRVSLPTLLQVRPLPAGKAGAFAAVLAPSEPLNQRLGGRMDLNIAESGSLSGSLQVGTQRYRLRGSVQATLASNIVSAVISIPRRNRSPLSLAFAIGDGEPDSLDGQLQDPEVIAASADLTGWHLPWSKKLPATAYTGLHNLLLAPPQSETETPALPRGQGFASFTPSRTGKTRLIGKLADGQSFAISSAVGARGQVAVHQLLYRGPWRGSLSGRLDVSSGAPQPAPLGNQINGTLLWNRPADTTGRSLLYPSGFRRHELQVMGSGYAALSQAVLLDLVEPDTEAQLEFQAAKLADLPTSPAISLRLLPRNGVVLPQDNPTRTTLRTNVLKGTFSGEFRVVDGVEQRQARFEGRVIHGLDGPYGAGFFLLPELGVLRPLILSGEVSLRRLFDP